MSTAADPPHAAARRRPARRANRRPLAVAVTALAAATTLWLAVPPGAGGWTSFGPGPWTALAVAAAIGVVMAAMHRQPRATGQSGAGPALAERAIGGACVAPGADLRFVDEVAHEIRNPLSSLRLAAEALRETAADEDRRHLIDIIDHDVRRIDRLLRDAAGAARLGADLRTDVTGQVDLAGSLRRLVAQMALSARRDGIALTADVPAVPMPVRGSEDRLVQVIVNLVANSVSLCRDGDAVNVWARRRDGRIVVVVDDTGPGIPGVALARIFDRFYSDRPSGFGAGWGGNSGLGLFIARQIVEAHGGVIWAENIVPTAADPGSVPMGARFVVGLPS